MFEESKGSLDGFPSPPGTSYFLIMENNIMIITGKVSVPSGDFLFFNNICICSIIILPAVSVPSGDFLFFNAATDVVNAANTAFPSPPGTSYFLIHWTHL